MVDPVLKIDTLNEIIKTRGLKKKWLAEQLGVSCSHLSNMVSGRSKFQKEYRKKLAHSLNIYESSLFGDAGKG